jgi:hypothetical protein
MSGGSLQSDFLKLAKAAIEKPFNVSELVAMIRGYLKSDRRAERIVALPRSVYGMGRNDAGGLLTTSCSKF